MPTPEGRVKDRVKRMLKAFECYYFMPVQGGRGAAGLDFHCVAPPGRAFFIETKAPKKDGAARSLSPRQESTAKTMRAAGAPVFVVNRDEDILAVAQWVNEVAEGTMTETLMQLGAWLAKYPMPETL